VEKSATELNQHASAADKTSDGETRIVDTLSDFGSAFAARAG
jgi:hypothetical protein